MATHSMVHEQPVVDTLAQLHMHILTQLGPSGATHSNREELSAALVHIKRALESLNTSTERTTGRQVRMPLSRSADSAAHISCRGSCPFLKNAILPNLLVLPLLAIAVCLVIALALMPSEGWDLQTSMQMMISVICGLTTPIGNANNVWPSTAFGQFWIALASVWALCLTGVVIGQFVAQGLFNACHVQLLRCFGASIQKNEKGLLRSRKAMITALVQVFFLAPLLFATVATILGVLLAATEQWRWTTGIQYVVANMAALPKALVTETPVTTFGARPYVDGSLAASRASGVSLP